MVENGGTEYDWSELVPGGVVVYYADGDEEILHANRYLLNLLECKDMAELAAHTGGSFRGLVHAGDLESTEDSIWGQVEERNGLDHIFYRVRTRSGRMITVDDYGRLVRSEGERPVFFVFMVEMDKGSVVDWLTGLPGLERFLYVAGIEASAIVSRGAIPAILVFDVMGMKAYNATSGREAGDDLLCSLGSILRQRFGSELCCRHEGDSFLALVAADEAEERARGVFGDFAVASTGALPLMAGACAVESGDDLKTVIDRAKFACDSDRSTWESHLSWYTDETRREALLRTHVLAHVDEAIAKGWVRPFYQGIVRSSTGRVCAAEALARWVDPELGLLPPISFVPALEEAGLLLRLDLHMIDCVVADLAAGIAQGGGCARARLGQRLAA